MTEENANQEAENFETIVKYLIPYQIECNLRIRVLYPMYIFTRNGARPCAGDPE